MSLHPTRTRLDLLQEVGEGEVFQHGDAACSPERVVSDRIKEQARAGWVHLVDLEFGSRQWQLLPAGEQLLDQHRPGWRGQP